MSGSVLKCPEFLKPLKGLFFNFSSNLYPFLFLIFYPYKTYFLIDLLSFYWLLLSYFFSLIFFFVMRFFLLSLMFSYFLYDGINRKIQYWQFIFHIRFTLFNLNSLTGNRDNSKRSGYFFSQRTYNNGVNFCGQVLGGLFSFNRSQANWYHNLSEKLSIFLPANINTNCKLSDGKRLPQLMTGEKKDVLWPNFIHVSR